MDRYSQIERLASLKSRGFLSEEEFAIEKKKILESFHEPSSDSKEASTETCVTPRDFVRQRGSKTPQLPSPWAISFEGRVNRSQFLVGWFGGILLFLFLGAFLSELGRKFFEFGNPLVFLPALACWAYGALYVISLAVRRFHDTGRAWAWILMLPIPLLGIFAGIVLMFFAGDAEKNEYGPIP